MNRYDKNGRNVTDVPGLWSEDDCEIVSTNLNRPCRPVSAGGQHTNGPVSHWIRMADGGEWIRCKERSLHQVIVAWRELGIEWFLENEVTE